MHATMPTDTPGGLDQLDRREAIHQTNEKISTIKIPSLVSKFVAEQTKLDDERRDKNRRLIAFLARSTDSFAFSRSFARNSFLARANERSNRVAEMLVDASNLS